MATPAGARAERFLRERHRDDWPRNLYAYDLDEVERVTGRNLIIENPAGRIGINAEYKSVDEGSLDLSALQFEIAADAGAEDIPAFVVQFTHPRLTPTQPWGFRLWPMNDLARRIGAVELTEQLYVQFLYVLAGHRGSYLRAGATVDEGIWFQPWAELSRLDDRWADPDVWPEVIPSSPRTIRRVNPPDEPAIRRFIDQLGRRLGQPDESATVHILGSRPALGAYRQAVPAPMSFERTTEILDRYDRLRWELNRLYRDWNEAPSDNNRDMWRPYNKDGTPRWSPVQVRGTVAHP